MPTMDIATAHYLQPTVMTTPGSYQPLFTDLPRGIASLAQVAHGVLIHEHIAGAYGVTLTAERRGSVHVRPVAGLLGRIMGEDGRPLTVAREPANRTPGNCRHFTVLAAAMLRAQGTPGRGAVSAVTSAPARSRTTGSVSTGTRARRAGSWPMPRSTTCSSSCSTSTST